MKKISDPIISYSDGQFVPTNKVTINVSQDMLGTFRGYRIFTACRTINGTVFLLQNHINRLFESASELSMKLPHTKPDLEEIIHQLLAKNSIEDDLLLQIMYSGGSPTKTRMSQRLHASLYIIVNKLHPAPDNWYKNGISLATYIYQRDWAHVKTNNYIGAVVAHQTSVKQQNADEALFISPIDNNTILEGSTFNIFMVNSNDEIITPPKSVNILNGITRQLVLELLRSNNIVVRETNTTLKDLEAIKEIFISSSTRNIVPVVRVDKNIIGNGTPGKVTRKASVILNSYLKSYKNPKTILQSNEYT